MALKESDAVILDAAHRFIALQAKGPELMEKAEDRLLSGTPGTIYLKRRGHRALSYTDFENIVNAHGTAEDKQTLIDFTQAKIDLQQRLDNTRYIGLVLEQAELTKNEFYYRVKQPSKWKAEEVIKLMGVLDRLQI